MKKKYEAPEFEVILLDLADVIRASGDPWVNPDEDDFPKSASKSKWG